jgi:hypothetical protein
LIAIISSSPLSFINNGNGKSNNNDFNINNLFAFAEKYKDNDNDGDDYSYFSQGQPIYKDNYEIDNDKKRHYYYHYPIKKEEIPECKQCFFSELKKLDKKTADMILDAIDKKFGDLTKLCKLIALEKIDRAELEEILNFIIFSNDDYNHYDKKQKNYYQNEYNGHDGAYNYKDKEEKRGSATYSNNNGYNTYSQNSYYSKDYNDYKMDNFDDNRKYDDDNPDKYYDKNYINNKNKNRYNDNYNDKDIKEQFIENVLDCLFEKIPRVYLVWRDDTSGNYDIFFRASNDGGQTFGKTINLSNNKGLSDDPHIAISGDNVYVVWRDTTDGNDRDILFRASNDGGQTFEGTIDLSDNDRESTQHMIAISGDNVYVVWRDELPNVNTEIFFRASNDGGQTFEGIIYLSDTDDTSNFADIAVSGDSVYMVWVEETEPANFDTFFRASNDGGQTFEGIINLSNSASVFDEPEILVSRSNVYVVWTDNSNGSDDDIFFRTSTDKGETFEDTIDLSDNDGDSFDPQMLTSGNNVYVVWTDNSNGSDEDIFFRTSTDKGETFEDTIDLSDNHGSSDDQRIVVSRNNVYVAWVEENEPANPDIFFRVSTDNGETFNPVINLSNNDGDSGINSSLHMLIYGNNVYVSWIDNSNGPDTDIFFRASNNNGQTFHPVIDLNDNEGGSVGQDMVVSGNNVYIAWTDNNGGDTDIFFRASNNYGQTFDPVINLSNNAGVSGNPVMLVG